MRLTFTQGDMMPEHWSQAQRAEMLQHMIQVLAQRIFMAYSQPPKAGAHPEFNNRPLVPEIELQMPNVQTGH